MRPPLGSYYRERLINLLILQSYVIIVCKVQVWDKTWAETLLKKSCFVFGCVRCHVHFLQGIRRAQCVFANSVNELEDI